MPTRKMPQNLDAEMSVLGIAFLNKNSLTKICEELYSDMFSTEDNQVLFNAIKHCYDEKIPVDITTIKEELDKKKKLSPRFAEYIGEVIDSVATASNLEYYMKKTKNIAIFNRF